MKLSVVIPTYNRRDSLRRTLDGLARQTHPLDDFEVLVVSDGSTDGTDAMLAHYADVAPYSLRPFCQPNSGPSVARNRGIREASHDVIVFLDDDVEPVVGFLGRHAAQHERDGRIVVLGPMSPDPDRAREEPAWIAWEHAKLQQTYNLFRPGGRYAEEGPREVHFYSGNASVRRRWLEAVGGFDETFKRQEDVELATRLARACGVRFVWDFEANGLHRPSRTFEAWLRIPYAYGALDAQRARAGQLSEQEVWEAARGRSSATRALTVLCLATPALRPSITGAVHALSISFQRRGLSTPALALLSGLYNASYMSAFNEETGREKASTKPAAVRRQFMRPPAGRFQK